MMDYTGIVGINHELMYEIAISILPYSLLMFLILIIISLTKPEWIEYLFYVEESEEVEVEVNKTGVDNNEEKRNETEKSV